MYLEGQEGQRGYAMAALLVAVAVMAVLMSVAMPVWRHQAQREKEAELAFRGEQWVKGLALWTRKNGPGTRPPSLDALVQQRMVRKKWKDPITGEDFVPVYMGQQPGAAPGGGRGTPPGGGRGTPPSGRGTAPGQPGGQPPGGAQGGVGGGIMGVRSASTATSIRIYQGQTRYDQWPFILAGQAANPGGGRGGDPAGRGVGPGGRGRGRGAAPGQGVRPGAGGQPGPGGPGRATLPGRGRGGL